MAKRKRAEVRNAVHRRIRRKVRGSTKRPRLAVYRSLNHIYAQVIDDDKSQTLASASTTEKDLRGSSGGNVAAAKRVGQAIAERALSAGIDQVVFDRGGYLYHGRVRALTDAARAAGLNKDETLAKEAEAAAAEKAAAEKVTADEASAQAAASAKEKSAKAKKAKKGESAGEAKPEAAEVSGEVKAAKEPKAREAKADEGSEVKAAKEPKAREAKAEEVSEVKAEAKEAKEE
jgi:large subunit ribosomal protein L18